MKRFLSLLGGILALSGAAAAANPMPLKDGESLTYRVSWAIVPGAGEIQISATSLPEAEMMRVTTTTSTRGLARLLLSFDARADSIFDLRSGQLLSIHEVSDTRGRRSSHSVSFDYLARDMHYTPDEDGKPRVLKLPKGEPLDLIMSLLDTRSWKIKPGEARDVLVVFNDEFYQLTIHAEAYETIETPMGEFQTLRLAPRMEKTPPKGIFRQGNEVRVWIAQDERHLPVRFEVAFKIGTGVATLTDYQPPKK